MRRLKNEAAAKGADTVLLVLCYARRDPASRAVALSARGEQSRCDLSVAIGGSVWLAKRIQL
jgi:hypothetical protein